MKKYKIKFNIYAISMFLIILAEVCFYKKSTINLYNIFVVIGIVLALFKGILSKKFNNLIIWFVMIYTMFLVYGIMFYQGGNFDCNALIIRFLENISLVFAISDLLDKNEKCLLKIFVLIGLISSAYLIINEFFNIISNNVRLGNIINDNVNFVGYSFGIISIFILWNYCNEKKSWKLLLLILLNIIMLLTGSKKTLIIIILNLIVLSAYSSNKFSKYIKLLILASVFYYVVINVPYFYNIMGRRIQDMFLELVNKSNSSLYSYSTYVRKEMIAEGITFFTRNPFFGGGWGYFAKNTIYGYSYSHNNYIEILCSFGVFGFIVFYSKHIRNIVSSIKIYFNRKNKGKNKIYFIFMLEFLVVSLFMDYTAVTFSSQCLWYIPIIMSTILNKKINGGIMLV